MSDATLVLARSLPYLMILAATGLGAQTVEQHGDNLPGEVPLSMFQMQASQVNLLTMGLQVSTDFDDNAVNGSQGQQGNLLTLIQPRVRWRFAQTRFDWEADYAPSFARSATISAYDSVAHRLDSGLQLKLTKRLRLRFHESFLATTNPFDQLRVSESTASVRNTSGEAVPATPADVRTEQASMDLAYAVGAHSTAGVGGDFFSARYSPLRSTPVPNQILQNSTLAGGRGYYTRQVTRHQWTGLDYSLQKSIFKNGQSWSLVQTMIVTHTIAVSRPFTLSFFAGPERSVTEMTGAFAFAPLVPVTSAHPAMWRWSGGVVGRWNWTHTNLTARYARKISNDAVLGAVQLSKISAEARRQFPGRWTARVLASHDDNKALAAPGSLTYFSAAGGLMRPVGPNLSLEFQYWRVHLSSDGSLPAALRSDYDRISISLIYDYKHPLGR